MESLVYKKNLDIVAYAEFDAEFNLKEFFLVDKYDDTNTEPEPTHNYWGNIKPKTENDYTSNIYQKGNEKYISDIVNALKNLNASHLVTDNSPDSTIPDSINIGKSLRVLVHVKYVLRNDKKSYDVEKDSFEIIGLCDKKLVFSLKEKESNFVHYNPIDNYENFFEKMRESLNEVKEDTSKYGQTGIKRAEHLKSMTAAKEAKAKAEDTEIKYNQVVEEVKNTAAREEEFKLPTELVNVQPQPENSKNVNSLKEIRDNAYTTLEKTITNDFDYGEGVIYNLPVHGTIITSIYNLKRKSNPDVKGLHSYDAIFDDVETLEGYLYGVKNSDLKYVEFNEIEQFMQDDGFEKIAKIENIEDEYNALKEAQDVYVDSLPNTRGGRKPQNTRKKRNRKIKRVSKRNLELK